MSVLRNKWLPQQQVLSILITMVMGIVAGFYLYLVGFAPIFTIDTTPDAETVDEFVIVGEAYGGCSRTGSCPTFRIAADGSFRYFYTPGIGQSQIVREGRLPFGLQRELHSALTKSGLETQSRVVTPSVCGSYSDGIDVRYEVTRFGEIFRLDSCGTAVVVEDYPWAALAKIWTYFETSN